MSHNAIYDYNRLKLRAAVGKRIMTTPANKTANVNGEGEWRKVSGGGEGGGNPNAEREIQK